METITISRKEYRNKAFDAAAEAAKAVVDKKNGKEYTLESVKDSMLATDITIDVMKSIEEALFNAE